MASQADTERGARVIPVPPPLYYVAGLAVGLAVDRLLPLPIGGGSAVAVAGALVTALGLAFTFTGVAGVIRHRTTIVPHRSVTTLLTSGTYRISRNPMYTGLAIAYIGVALLFHSWWPLVLWPLAILAVRKLVIRPEEEYLTQRFGRTYTDYQTRVRRWL